MTLIERSCPNEGHDFDTWGSSITSATLNDKNVALAISQDRSQRAYYSFQ